ncbi:hypothetical protein [Lysobacter antibioticus]|uniref:hypothetical protein n=1 Tax=Lysobacter antibioticus TaxID=84531 RepID=UPI0007E8D8F1|nr:hypothetical protein [Lysobacter antibioticus]
MSAGAVDVLPNSKWRRKSDHAGKPAIATVLWSRDGYVRFHAPWTAKGITGKAMDAFLAHYQPASDQEARRHG